MRLLILISILFISYKALSGGNEPLINDGYINARKELKSYSMEKPTSNLSPHDVSRIWNYLTNGHYDRFKTCDFKIHYTKNNQTKSLTHEITATCTE